MAVQAKTLKFGSIFAIVAVVGIIVLFSSAYTMDEREQAIITQFGEPIGDPIIEPGLHFKVPFIQDVRRFDKRLMRWDGDVNQVPTLGREFIVVDTTARWRVIDPLLFLKSVRSETGAQSRLDDIIDSVVRDKVSSTDLEEIVRSKDFEINPDAVDDVALQRDDIDLSKPKKGREELTREILADSKLLMPQYGVKLLDIRIKRLNYIDSVRRKVEERMISERQRVAEQFRSEGQGRSAEIDGETERSVREIVSEAEREAETIRGEADATATAIYGEAFSADPEFYAFFKTLESYRSSVGDNTTLVLPADSRFYRYLKDVGVPE